MKTLVTGGSGFIGSHLVDRLLLMSEGEVIVYDKKPASFSNKRVKMIVGDIKDLKSLTKSMEGCTAVFHLASNPDISKAMVQPSIDFWEGTLLTQNVLEAMRVNGIQYIIYASGSGVYGDTGRISTPETLGPMLPISTYGASKIAGEALICSYCHLFGMRGRVYRFANVVGPCQTHGIVYDLVRKILTDPSKLQILGDGSQSKSYIHVDDVLDAIFWTLERGSEEYAVFNVATDDYITVKEIAEMVVNEVCENSQEIVYEFTAGDRGWRGDVPIVRFDLRKIHHLGWYAKHTSKEAIHSSILPLAIAATVERALL